jgi:hypothetical protein
MPDPLEEHYSVRLYVHADLKYQFDEGPQSDEQVEARAKRFEPRLAKLFGSAFPLAKVEVETTQARYGSAKIAQFVKLLFDGPEGQIDCRKAISEFVDAWQVMIETEWAIQEGPQLIYPNVSISLPRAQGATNTALPAATAGAPIPVRRDDIMRAIKLREGMIWTFLGIGIALGVVAGFVWFRLDDLNDELQELRNRASIEHPMTNSAQPVVVTVTEPTPIVLRPEPPTTRACPDCPVVLRIQPTRRD